MAKAKTGIFTITEEVLISSATANSNIPIGSLIDVGDAQALEIVSVDYTFQSEDGGAYEAIYANRPFTGDASIQVQLLDKQVAAGVSCSDNNVISSAAFHWNTSNLPAVGSDFYPDDFKGTNGRFVVNDELYVFVDGGLAGYAAGTKLAVGVRIRAKVVKLSTRDWMAISLETVQNE